MAKSDTKKVRSKEIVVVCENDIPQSTYFEGNGFKIIAKVEKGQYIVTRYGWSGDPEVGESIVVTAKDTVKLMESYKVPTPEALVEAVGNRFARKEAHKCFDKIKLSLQRRGVPYTIK